MKLRSLVVLGIAAGSSALAQDPVVPSFSGEPLSFTPTPLASSTTRELLSLQRFAPPLIGSNPTGGLLSPQTADPALGGWLRAPAERVAPVEFLPKRAPMPVIEPDPALTYAMPIVTPNPAIDYKLHVLETK